LNIVFEGRISVTVIIRPLRDGILENNASFYLCHCMRSHFKAKIYKVGINLCVKVPFRITKKMTPVKGYIPVNGKIGNHEFRQTLCPVKGEEYRLYVNGPMLAGSGSKLGDTMNFSLEQGNAITPKDLPMPEVMKKKLNQHKLLIAFKNLTPYRQKEVLKYLNSLRTEESIIRNVEKLISQLQVGKTVQIP
jgi:hypothetical protein